MNLNGADKRLVNLALGFYVILEIVVITYVAIWISLGY
jgi:hypothetical protein